MNLKPKKETNTGEWLNTYADMITLILCFFVLLYSMSSVDSEKWENLVKSLNPNATDPGYPDGTAGGYEYLTPSVSGTTPVTESPTDSETPPSTGYPDGTEKEDMDIKNIYDRLTTHVEENALGGFVDVYKADGYAFIVFRNKIFFEGDKYELLLAGKQILDVFNSAITGIESEIGEIRVFGHTAQAKTNQPNDIRTDRTLSSDRADEVAIYIQLGVPALPGKKIVAHGYGQHYPVAPNDSETNRAKNRRVEILVAKSSKINMSLEDIYKELEIGIITDE